MYAYRIDIFHITYCNTVACGVAHHLVLYLFPAGNTTFHQHFSHTAETQSVGKNLYQFCFVVGDTSAASSQCISGTEHYRIPDSIGKFDTVFHVVHNKRSRARLSDFFHCIFKFLTIFRLADGFRRGSDQTYALLSQKAGFIQFHTKVQSCLSAQCRKHAVRFFFYNNLF